MRPHLSKPPSRNESAAPDRDRSIMRRLLVAHSYASLLERLPLGASEGGFLLLASSRPAADEAVWTAPQQGTLGAHRLTLIQLAHQLAMEPLAALGLAPITALAMEALIARAADSIRKRGGFTRWEAISLLPGFVPAVRSTLETLLLNRVGSDQLPAAQADLAVLLEEFETLRAQSMLAHTATVLQLAMGVSTHPLLGLPVIALDVPLRTGLEADFAARCLARSRSGTVLQLASDKASIAAWTRILGVEPERIPESGDCSLARIRTAAFSPERLSAHPRTESLEYFAAPGEGLECVEIARRIQRLAAAGVRLDEIAILLRHPLAYQPLVEEAMRRADLPVYFTHGSARPDPAGRAFLALLECARERLSATRFAEYLSFAQAPRENGVAAPLAWERLLVDAAVIGGADRWKRRIEGLLVEIELQRMSLAEDDARRESLSRRQDQLTALAEFALPLIDDLASLPVSALWRDWNQRLTALAESSLRDPQAVLNLLQELRVMDESGPADLEEVILTLRSHLGELRPDPPPRRFGCVFAGSIEEARGRRFRFVFLPGLGEGQFPKRVLEDPLLLDEARAAIDDRLETNSARAEQERLLLRIAIAAATERLTISYSTMDAAQSRARVPSFYALETIRAATGEFPRLAVFEREARAAASAGLGWPAPSDPGDAIDNAEYDLAVLHRSQHGPGLPRGAAWYLLEANASLGRSLRARYIRWESSWRPADGLVGAHPLLENHRLRARTYSATRLQDFAACPYRFLLASIHGLSPRPRVAPLEQLDPLTRGQLFHEVQSELTRSLRDRDRLPLTMKSLDAVSRECDAILYRLAERYADDLAPAIPRVWRAEIDALRADLRGWLREVAHDPGWVPVETEFAFGEKNGERNAVLVRDRLLLQGRIDLIEQSPTGELRVTDHKTGRAPNAPAAATAGGTVLQPLLYAAAAQELLGRPVATSRLFYCTARGGYEQHRFSMSLAAFAALDDVLRIIDGYLESGFLVPFPDQGACDRCDYRPVCGPYEPLRTARKDAKGTGNLITLRSLP
jgi:ATP-dependent helicase/nuclease subunit B